MADCVKVAELVTVVTEVVGLMIILEETTDVVEVDVVDALAAMLVSNDHRICATQH